MPSFEAASARASAAPQDEVGRWSPQTLLWVMDSAYLHCEQLVRAADKDRFLATLFAPAEKRGPLFALYAFNIEIASVRERAREPMPGEIRLQWWRDVINGERAVEAVANPVAAALIETAARFSLPRARLLDLIEAHAFDLYDDPM